MTVGRPTAAAKCTKPLSTPITPRVPSTKLKAFSRSMGGQTRASGAAAAIRSARALSPFTHGSTGVNPAEAARRATSAQKASGQSFVVQVVP